MYKSKRLAVSIPAYNEELLIQDTLKSIPEFVDDIIIVNDGSQDKTADKVNEYMKSSNDNRINFIDSKINEGLGATIIKAHEKAIANGADIILVMAGDNQMDPNYIPKLVDPIIDNDYDYTKGNRYVDFDSLRKMPLFRVIGNTFITFLCKFSTGYWSVADPLNGYTAIKSSVFSNLNIRRIGKRYDFELTLFSELYLINSKIKDVFIPARYGREKSTIKIFRESFRTLGVLFRAFIRRMLIKNTLLNFSPVGLFYILGILLFITGVTLGIIYFVIRVADTVPSAGTTMLVVLPIIFGVQFILQGLSFDIQAEPK